MSEHEHEWEYFPGTGMIPDRWNCFGCSTQTFKRPVSPMTREPESHERWEVRVEGIGDPPEKEVSIWEDRGPAVRGDRRYMFVAFCATEARADHIVALHNAVSAPRLDMLGTRVECTECNALGILEHSDDCSAMTGVLAPQDAGEWTISGHNGIEAYDNRSGLVTMSEERRRDMRVVSREDPYQEFAVTERSAAPLRDVLNSLTTRLREAEQERDGAQKLICGCWIGRECTTHGEQANHDLGLERLRHMEAEARVTALEAELEQLRPRAALQHIEWLVQLVKGHCWRCLAGFPLVHVSGSGFVGHWQHVVINSEMQRPLRGMCNLRTVERNHVRKAEEFLDALPSQGEGV